MLSPQLQGSGKMASFDSRITRSKPARSSAAGERMWERFTDKLNLPVQGTRGRLSQVGAGVYLWERRADAPTSAFPVLAVHDEIVVECSGNQADEGLRLVEKAMVDA